MAGTTPITAGVLRFSLTFNPFAKTITFTDLLQAYNPYGGNMKGILSLVDPDGIVFYQNAGWASQDFSSPDTNSTTPTWTKTLSGVNYPVDSNGDLKLGYYTINYMVTAGAVAYVVSTQVWNMDYERVTADVEMLANVLASALTVTDNTLYNVLHNMVAVVPTVTRLMTIQYPKDPATGVPVETDVTTSLSTITIGPDIYTSVFTALLSSSAVYNLQLWDSAPCLIVNDTIQSETILDVKRDNCMCQYYDCISAVQLQMNAAEASNPAEYEKLRLAKTRLNDYILLYQWALSCGKDSSMWCTLIKQLLLETVPCDCAEDTGAPVEIIPVIGGGGGSVTASTFRYTFGTGDTGFPGGAQAGDVHEFTLDDTLTPHVYNKCDIYKYSGTAWVFQLNSKGADGANSTVAGPPGENGVAVFSDQTSTGTAAGTLEEILVTVYPDFTKFTKIGDCLHFEANLELGLNDHGKIIKLYCKTTQLLAYMTDKLIDADNRYVKVEGWITWKGASTIYAETMLITRDAIRAVPIGLLSIAPLDVYFAVSGQNVVATADDVKYLNSRLLHYIQGVLP